MLEKTRTDLSSSSAPSRRPGSYAFYLFIYFKNKLFSVCLISFNIPFIFSEPSCMMIHYDNVALYRLDNAHVVFGKVVENLELVKKIEGCGSNSGKTSSKIVIADCGQLS